MCGIVAGIAERNVVPVLLEGLRRLEYRGYDSCGVAVLRDGAPHRVRSLTRVRSLDAEVREMGLEGGGVDHHRRDRAGDSDEANSRRRGHRRRSRVPRV